MTTSNYTPMLFNIYQYDKVVSGALVGQTSIGLILAEELIQFYGLEGIRKQGQGHINKYNSILRFLERELGEVLTIRTDIFNYFSKHGKTNDNVEFFGVVSDEDASGVREIVREEIISRVKK